MMVIFNKRSGWLIICCFGGLLNAVAQPALKTSIDNNGILIGEPIKLKVVATMPKQDFFVKWISIPDSLEHFEIVEKSKIDSVFANQKLTGLSQTITLTSFDSGKWVLPAFDVDFNPSNGDSAYHFFTDTFPVTVSYQADSSNALRDIKPVREAKKQRPVWYWFVAAGVVILLVALCIWLFYYFKKRKKVAPKKERFTAYEKAMNELDKLRQMNLSNVDTTKEYHSKLTDLLKEYLASQHGEYFKSSTTAEVLVLLKQNGFDKNILAKTEDALRCSDAAKFAKYVPSIEQSKTSWVNIKKAIDTAEKLNIKSEESVS